jgi:hypothetical protein
MGPDIPGKRKTEEYTAASVAVSTKKRTIEDSVNRRWFAKYNGSTIAERKSVIDRGETIATTDISSIPTVLSNTPAARTRDVSRNTVSFRVGQTR